MAGPNESFNELTALIGRSLSGKGEVNSFIANSAHRLRSTLTVMRIHAELIQSGTYGSIEGDLLEKVGVLETSIDEMSHFIDSMQDLSTASNLQAGTKMRRADLYAITYDVMKGYTSQQSSRIKLSLSNSPVVEVLTDEFLARKALGHLMSYTLSGTEAEASFIDLKVEICDEGPSVLLRSGVEPLLRSDMESLVRSMLRDASALSVQEWKRFSLPLAVFFGNHIGSRLRIIENDEGTYDYRMIFRAP